MSHVAVALAVQLAVGLATGRWLIGGLLVGAFYVGREFTQAEYRWIAAFADGKRENMPLLAGFDPLVWNVKSLADFILPLGSSIVLFGGVSVLRRLSR